MADIQIDHAEMESLLRDVRRSELESAGRELLGLCVEEVPVDTGRLRSSHRFDGTNADATEATLSANTDYAFFVHDGHRLVAWGHETGRYVPGNPWMRRAMDRLAAMSGGA